MATPDATPTPGTLQEALINDYPTQLGQSTVWLSTPKIHPQAASTIKCCQSVKES